MNNPFADEGLHCGKGQSHTFGSDMEIGKTQTVGEIQWL